MRKVLLSLVAIAAAVFATSCTNDLLDEGVKGGNRVTFNISTPELATRAFGDGATATDLYYAVYEGDTILNDISVTPGETPVKLQGGKTSIMLDLASGIEYNLIFWAAAPGAIDTLYNVDFANKSMNLIDPDKFVSQNENLDAFYAYVPNVKAGKDEDVELYRPFAQLNISVSNADILAAKNANLEVAETKVVVKNAYKTLNLVDGTVADEVAYTFNFAALPTGDNAAAFPKADYTRYAMNYLLVDDTKKLVEVEFAYNRTVGANAVNTRTFGNVPVQRNYRTNIYGDLLTKSTGFEVEIKEAFVKDDKYGVEDGKTYIRVANAEEFNAAIVDPNIDMVILENDIVLTSTLTRAAADATLTISKGKEFVIDLGGKTLSATSTETGKNYNMIDVRGTLTVKNGTITTEHKGTNMAWGNSTNVFDVTDGGVLNLDGVTAKNLGGSDMAFVAHLNNWGEVTLNVENSYLESTYVAVRVFNSGNDMNNVTFKNSTFKSPTRVLWVHNYTLADFGNDAAKTAAHQALLNFDIYNGTNTFIVENINRMFEYGFTDAINLDEDGNVINGENAVTLYQVSTIEELQAALNAINDAGVDAKIYVRADLVGNVTIVQKANVDLYIDGKDFKYDGVITVNGDGRSTGAETLTLANINFETTCDDVDGFTFINAPSKMGSKYNYSHNVTIDGCTFTNTIDNPVVGSASFTGTYNFVMTNCKATNMHSLLQTQSCDNTVKVENVEVINGKNGISFGNTANPTIKGAVIEAVGYGVRGDANASRGNLVLEGCEISAAKPVIIRKTTTAGYAITFNGENTLTTDADYQVVFTSGDDEAAFVAPTVGFTLNGADDFIVFPREQVVKSAETLKSTLEAAGSAGAGDTTISLVADINMTGKEWTPIKVDGYHGADIVTFDGKGHTIKGLTSALFAGGFAGGSGIVIKNLTIEDSAIVATNTQGYGAFVCNADSMDKITLINCHLKNSSIITPNDGTAESRIGGLVGWTAGYNVVNDGPVDSYITIKDCSVIGCTLKGAGSIGAICGHAGANAATFTTIENCTATNNKLISTDDGGWRVGVVVGTANNGQCVIKNITESGNTLEQTGKTAPVGGEKRNYYGRFVPAGTGHLTIDGVAIE